jgi:hypothetical protein
LKQINNNLGNFIVYSSDSQIDRASFKKPTTSDILHSSSKTPQTLMKLKEKELSNAQNQLLIYQKENEKLKKKLLNSQNTKDTIVTLTSKLKELEESNQSLTKEIVIFIFEN